MSRPTLRLKFNREGSTMADKSVAEKAMEETACEVGKPDFDRALRVIWNDIDPVTEDISEKRGDLSAAWKILADECHVNKTAARWYRKLKGSSAEQRDDILRSFKGLLDGDGAMAVQVDLVDLMAGGAVHAPAPQNAKPEARAAFDDADLEGVVGEMPDRGGLTSDEVQAMGAHEPADVKPQRRRPALAAVGSYN